MPTDTLVQRSDLIATPTAVVALMVVLLLVLWVAAHALGRRFLGQFPGRGPEVGAFAARVAIGTVALWSLWQLVARFITLETTWPLLVNGFVGALALEIVFTLYRWERRVVSPRLGRTLLVLRTVAIAAVLIILAQPVYTWTQNRKIERRVIVAIDDSESMQLVDRQMSATERLDVAAFRGAGSASRPALGALTTRTRELLAALTKERESWGLADSLQGAAVDDFFNVRGERVAKTLDEGLATADAAAKALEAARGVEAQLDDTGRRLVNEAQSWLCDQAPAEFRAAQQALAQKQAPRVRDALGRATEIVQRAVESMPALQLAVDEAVLRQLDAPSRTKVDDAALVSRATVAREALTRPTGDGQRALIDQLRETYDVTVLRFGRTAAEVPQPDFAAEGTDDDFRLRTDVTGALEEATKRVPAESLAGVLMVGDGRHNADKPVDDAARSLGLTGAPVHAIAVGSAKGPKDAAFLKVEAPEAIYLGDKVKIRADVKADGMRGGQLKLTLSQGEKVLETQTVSVPEDTFRTSVRLAWTPEEKGIFPCTLKIEPVDGELFADNNKWEFETAVTDDRTNVLLVDAYPRWEFRYLRNLFYGRDKSVHLQYVLLNPDEITDQAALVPVLASATRKFGDAEATRLPESRDEWMKFDVIILGDVPPAAISTTTWETLEKCVGERGAMLVVVAGPRSMPHAHTAEIARKLLPAEFAPGNAPLTSGPEPSFSLRLTTEGKNSPILQQSPSQIENASIWAGLPDFMWRHPVRAVKPGAEVLAYAEPAGRDFSNAGSTAEERLTAFARQRQLEAEHALIVTSRFGLGKVALFNFDETWRLRYGVGDTYHHRLWGNLLRWGTPENLRAGSETVRLGTDKLTYETGDRVKILAKLTADGFRPETKADVTAVVTDPGGNPLTRRKLVYREGSSGLYEADLDPLPRTGRYRVELTGGDVDRLLRGGSVGKVETHFTQLATLNPVELGDLSLDTDTLRRVTSLSGGRIVAPAQAHTLAEAFGAGTKTVQQPRETTLWDNWPVLLLALAALTAEWIIRRKSGLA